MNAYTTEVQQPQSPTAHLLQEIALFGYRPNGDEHDYRPLPTAETVEIGVAGIFESLETMFTNTRLEDELSEVLWAVANVFHRRLTRAQKKLDDNEAEQRSLIAVQDGSEISSVELERKAAEGDTLTEMRNAFEAMRDLAADHYRVSVGYEWLPRTGSKTSFNGLTAAVIDSRDYLARKRHEEKEIYCPTGTKIAFTGGADYQDHEAIFHALDQTHKKYPDMVLIHGGSPKGAELIAAKWAELRKVAQVVCKPDWTAHRNKSAPFKRNDKIVEMMPKGMIVTPGNGINQNLADKARKAGIPLMKVGF
ncbi:MULTISPECIES: DUF2493 domain-containing protein [Martelella]|jgi:hypothetical protein|uniref:YspA cpYpsA-related SLOG domain-containing protein n=1 Tax=Martelella mediterranea DSM 17316 TaxID=1122214 RepID=A0A1U9Z956_9HYPH|nr:DUF2493 domain-containing protein [Martelella mediterranea]AQZ54241.1 hypothetical protein Mame_04949 [Martelella mediterranea DSM 17316]|tara:strand:- start:773 stop:1693 length:921 start_codon:yes stop_codon:yes gene_type:complete